MPLSQPSQNYSPPLGALFFALIALAWCGYMAFPLGESGLCFSSGCGITEKISIAGVSLWWVGGGYFFLFSIICLRGLGYLAWRISQLALFCDSLLLLLMLITGPCINCLIIAFFFAITNFLTRPTPEGWFKKDKVLPRSILLPLWFGLFISNCFIAGNEAIPRYTMNNSASASVRIYFSPSCPACRDAVESFGNQAQLLPVLEEDSDVGVVTQMQGYIAQGKTPQEALTLALENPMPKDSLPMPLRVLMTISMLRNKAEVVKQGFRQMPLIEINGMPKGWSAKSHKVLNLSLDIGSSESTQSETPFPVEGQLEQKTSNSTYQERASLVPLNTNATKPNDTTLDFLDVDKLSQCGEGVECPDK